LQIAVGSIGLRHYDGLAMTFFRKVGPAHVRHPNLYGPKTLRTQRVPTLVNSLIDGSRHIDLPCLCYM